MNLIQFEGNTVAVIAPEDLEELESSAKVWRKLAQEFEADSDHYREALEHIANSTVNVENRGACALVDIALAALVDAVD